MSWILLILLNATFFIRPADLVQSADIPLYNMVMIACLMVSGPRLLNSVATASRVPITACVLGVVLACVLSHLSHANLHNAVDDGVYIAKIVIYYLLIAAIVDSPARLRSFLRWIVVFTLILTSLALAHYHGIVVIAALEAIQQRDIDPETGDIYFIPRLCSTGVFNDPNDLSMIIVLAVLLCLYFADESRGVFVKVCWLAPVALLFYGLKLTYSRGGILNLGLSLAAVCYTRFGWKKTLMASVVALPVIFAVFGGRMTKVDVGDTNDTSQHRIQLWSDGLLLFRESPIFGIGMNEYADRAGLVAHNSFIHTYAELGFFGGTLFVGAFYAAFSGVRRLFDRNATFSDPSIMALRPYMLGMICSYCVGMFSLSRPYTITTYAVLGIAAAYLRIAEHYTSVTGLRFDSQFVQRLILIGVGCLLFILLFVRLTVRWN